MRKGPPFFTWGEGHLEIGSTDRQSRTKPGKVTIGDNLRVRAIVCGDDPTYALKMD